MPKLPRLIAAGAEALLLRNGFIGLRSKRSHRIYAEGGSRVVVPFHNSATLKSSGRFSMQSRKPAEHHPSPTPRDREQSGNQERNIVAMQIE
jgi:predicted RNA binding protein YcfA (HicA-like mRNA interferase family)